MLPARSALTVGVAAATALAVAACGGSSPVTVTKTVVRQPTGTTAPTTTTNSPAQTTTSTVGTACSAADLSPVLLGTNGAAGTIVLGFALKNTGTASCHTYGWPGVQFLSARGTALTTGSTRTTSDVAGATPATAITLKPGEEASFRMTASDVPTGGGSCPTAAKLQIYAPDDKATMTVAVPGIAACGKSTVSPMMPGDSAFSGEGGGSGGSGNGGSGSSGNGGSGSGSGGSGSGGGQAGLNGSGGSTGSTGSTGSGGASVSG